MAIKNYKSLSYTGDQTRGTSRETGAEGKQKPTTSHTSNNSQTHTPNKTPKAAEPVRTQEKVEPVKGKGVAGDKWTQPLSTMGIPRVGAKYASSSPPRAGFSGPAQDHQPAVTKYTNSSPPRAGFSAPTQDKQRVVAKYANSSPPKAGFSGSTQYNLRVVAKHASSSPPRAGPTQDNPRVAVADHGGSGSPKRVEPIKDHGEYSSPMKVHQMKDPGVTNKKLPSPLGPVAENPQYGNNSPRKVEPRKDTGVTNDKWRNPKWSRPLSPERHPQVAVYDYNSTIKFEPVKDNGFANDRRLRPDGYRQDHPQVTVTKQGYCNIHTIVEGRREPEVTAEKWGKARNLVGHGRITTHEDNWKSSGRNISSVPPSRHTPLTSATNDIHQITEMLREAARSAPRTRETVPASKYYTETIDNNEAQRRFGNLSESSGPYKTEEGYAGTIDTKEAARRYNGAMV